MDLDFQKKYSDRFDKGEKIALSNVYAVVSLGEEYKGYHYKLVAKIFENID